MAFLKDMAKLVLLVLGRVKASFLGLNMMAIIVLLIIITIGIVVDVEE